MTMRVKTEADRIPEAVKYAKMMIEEIERGISSMNYTEDVNGNLEYNPRYYSEEKCELENKKEEWKTMLYLLTAEAPFSKIAW